MKTISIFASVILIFMSCSSQKKAIEKTDMIQEDLKIEYTANTRGFYEKRIIENQTISISKDRNGIEKPVVTKISDADWKELLIFYKEVNLKQLSSLKAPTEHRFYDGAAIANLKVISGVTTYETTEFDNGYPPAEIKKLVDKLVSL